MPRAGRVSRLAGRIAVVRHKAHQGNGDSRYGALLALIKEAVDAGAAGIVAVLQTSSNTLEAFQLKVGWGGEVLPVPVALVGQAFPALQERVLSIEMNGTLVESAEIHAFNVIGERAPLREGPSAFLR
ncbi:unnamed protein product [Polarella glacialis]|uniref:Uncharacterized protein n=1 Tax=Polarella glacialis TaxID=89957 RepID=A0A813FFL7_POLGL|nr:unnamed protein product [Polarella glacialis]CAE8651035.1 unnamed protein product [Polarella glacialis]